MARKAINSEFKQLMEEYGVSPTYFHKLRTSVNGDMEELRKALDDYKARREGRALRKIEPVKQKKVPISTTDDYQGSYKIKIPDHLMSRDEFFIFMEKHIRKSVYVLRGKYYTLKQNNIDNEDLIMDILYKCLRPTKDGKLLYDEYVANPGRLKTIRCFVNTICRNHFKDYLKGVRYTTPVTSLDLPLPGSDNLTIGDSIGVEDIDDISINELVEVCSHIEVSKRKNSENVVLLSDILEEILLGVPLTTVCHNLKVSSKVVQKRFLEAGIEEILGRAISQERRDKILGNC